jgi:hypothetical protein
MATEGSLPDWITATATGITAVAAGFAAFVAWLAFRRDARASLPVVEADLEWDIDGASSFVLVTLTIRNRLEETITLDSARVKRPDGTLISNKIVLGNDGRGIAVKRGDAPFIKIEREIQPLGSPTESYFQIIQRTDVFQTELFLSPPNDWDGGWIRIDLRISSKALTIRDKRMVIKRRISPKPAKQTEAKANNHGALIPQ